MLSQVLGQRAEILDDPWQEPGLVEEWRALAVAQGNAFTTPEWFRAYATHYGAEGRPFVVRLRDDDGGLVGLLPLCRTGRSLGFAGANVGDRFGPVAVPGREAEVAAQAGRVLGARGREAFVLHNVDTGAPWVRAFGSGLGIRATPALLREEVLPFVPLAGHTWETFLEARSRNFRSQVRRKERALTERHGATFRRLDDPGCVPRDVKTFFALHAARWNERDENSTILGPAVQGFHTDFAAAALERGWLRMTFLEVEGQAVAALYAWRVGGRYAYFQAGFDPEWAEASVGLVLMAHSVREAIEEGADEYDLLLGGESYKARFATDERRVESLVVAGTLHPVRLLAQLDAGARRAADGLSPRMRARLRSAAAPVLSRMPGTRSR